MSDVLSLLAASLLILNSQSQASTGVDVSGHVELPELCSPAISPAIVSLEPLDAPSPESPLDEPRFMNQRGLRFEPRVLALHKCQLLKFGNADPELHNVHILGTSLPFSQSVPSGGSVDFSSPKSGVFKVVCDIHSHMRAFIVIGDSPWIADCGRTGDFRFRNVPSGRYRLHVWHELAAPSSHELIVSAHDLLLDSITVKTGPNPATADDRELVCETGCEPWPLVIDRVALTLASSLDAAQQTDHRARAFPLAQNAFYKDYEASGMQTAVRVHLGFDRASKIEELFAAVDQSTHDLLNGKATSSSVITSTRHTLLQLAKASEDLNRKGVTERSKLFAATSPAFWVADDFPETAARNFPTAFFDRHKFHARRAILITLAGAILLILDPIRNLRNLHRFSCTTNNNGKSRPLHRLGRTVLKTAPLRPLLLITLLAIAGVISYLNLNPSIPHLATPPAPSPPAPKASSVPIPTGALTPRRTIGHAIQRNHLKIVAAWVPTTRQTSEIRLEAHIHASAGNPHGFAQGEWIPYLNIHYTIESSDGRPLLNGALAPMIASDGPRYGANVLMPGSGQYRLILQIEPPAPSSLARSTDPDNPAAPWWEPFPLSFDWSYSPS